MNLKSYLKQQIRWSEKTFGPGCRNAGITDHIIKELVEINQASTPREMMAEWVDVVILALDGAWRAGFTADQVCFALEEKLKINRSREWPDWRAAEPGKAIEHIRGENERS